ncbi:MAG: hypothetical protein HN368_12380 [Spirochaetales bacterium]|nr:hypothetical protein [Spirochaetales bacterium]
MAVDSTGAQLYLACGNGVLISRDAGANWVLTGGSGMAEVQKVQIDRRDPDRAWAASAFGLWETRDGGTAWTRLKHTSLFRFCADVRQDAVDPDTLWVAGDRGVFVSRDAGKNFAAALINTDVRRVVSLPARLLLCTDGGGLLESKDDGRTFSRITGSPDVVFCVEVVEDRLYCGTMNGLYISRDSGLSWSVTTEGVPEGYFIYGVVADPEKSGRVFICGNDGVLVSEDSGISFKRHGFESALVQDLTIAQLGKVDPVMPSQEPGSLQIPDDDRIFEDYRGEEDPEFRRRVRDLRIHFRGRAAAIAGWPGWATASQEIVEGRGTKELYKQLRERLKSPQHSMFYSLPLMGLYLHANNRMSSSMAATMRQVMTTNPVYRGDTENHWVMYYTALLLAAQTWPETSAAEWYAGRSTQSLYDEAREWLIGWAGKTTEAGQGEYDSPNYMIMYVTPMLLLYDFAKEPLLHQLAGMILDLLLADYFTESLEGAWCGGHSRVTETEIDKTRTNRVSVYHYLYAGGIPLIWGIHDWFGFAAQSGYRPPEILERVANGRRFPFVHTEVKRTRNVIRYWDEPNPRVDKYTYMTSLYSLGSLRGDVLAPVQQHAFDVTWNGSAENSLLFSVHPFVSGSELGKFFPQDTNDLARTVIKQKPIFGSENKIISGSPYEKVYQYENILVALYSVPEDVQYPHVNLYWPKCLTRSEEGGWLFGQDGDFFLALHVPDDGIWRDKQEYERYRFSANRTSLSLVVRAPEGVDNFEHFKAQVLASPPPAVTWDAGLPILTYENNSYPQGGKSDKLFDGPFLSGELGSQVIRITDGVAARILDFNDYTITER